MMRLAKLVSAASLLSACTFSTGSDDRQVVDQLDFDMNMTDMSAHATQQIDIALVTNIDAEPNPVPPGTSTLDTMRPRYALRGRSRVLLPPAPASGGYPDVHARLARIVENEDLQVLFYADSEKPSFRIDPLRPDGMRLEHSWIRDLPPDGELTFAHLFVFENFYDSEIRSEGADIVLEVPALTPARSACLDAELAKVMKTDLAVRVFFEPASARTQVCGFQMYPGNTVPTEPIRFKGLSDINSRYGVETLVDGARIFLDGEESATLTNPATTEGLSIPFTQWYPVPDAAIATCLAMP